MLTESIELKGKTCKDCGNRRSTRWYKHPTTSEGSRCEFDREFFQRKMLRKYFIAQAADVTDARMSVLSLIACAKSRN